MLTSLTVLDRVRPLLADHPNRSTLSAGGARRAWASQPRYRPHRCHGAIALTFDLARRLGCPPTGSTTSAMSAASRPRQHDYAQRDNVDIARFRGDTLADDPHGRDFTINALPCRWRTHGRCSDRPPRWAGRPGGGAPRTIHDHSIADDLGAPCGQCALLPNSTLLTDETAADVRAAGPLLAARTSAERVRDELGRLMSTDAPYNIIGSLFHYNLAYVLPEVKAMSDVAQSPPHREDVLSHTYSVMDELLTVEDIIAQRPVGQSWAGAVEEVLSPYRSNLAAHLDATLRAWALPACLRWSALLHDVGKPATQTIDEAGRIRFLGHDDAGRR
jgi:hypothetical protein